MSNRGKRKRSLEEGDDTGLRKLGSVAIQEILQENKSLRARIIELEAELRQKQEEVVEHKKKQEEVVEHKKKLEELLKQKTRAILLRDGALRKALETSESVFSTIDRLMKGDAVVNLRNLNFQGRKKNVTTGHGMH